jgi:hypothetical protein
LPPFGDLSDPPEQVLRVYAERFLELLGWWEARSAPLQELIESTGFDWEAHHHRELARSAPSRPFDLEVHLLGEPLGVAVAARLSAARRVQAEDYLDHLERRLAHDGGCSRLLTAVRSRDLAEYRTELSRRQGCGHARSDRVSAAAPSEITSPPPHL